MLAGERIANIRHMFNVREGINVFDIEIAGRAVGIPPLKEGSCKDVTLDVKSLMGDYAAAMKWDLNTSKPDAEHLKEIGLGELAKDL
jgi:aldehyde:ferredoxin oxidoreductase